MLTAKAFFAQNGKVNLGGEIVVAKLCTAFEVSTRVIWSQITWNKGEVVEGAR